MDENLCRSSAPLPGPSPTRGSEHSSRWAEGPPSQASPEGVREGLHAILGYAVASTEEGHPAQDAGDVDHTAPRLPHQGQHIQGHVNHPQQVHLQNLHKVLFGQPLVGCRGCANAGIVHQTPESWEEWGREGNTVLGPGERTGPRRQVSF